jgi:hypothetical protein
MQGISRLAGKILPLEADLLPRQFVINWMVIWLVISVYTVIRRYMIATTESFVKQPKNERVNESMNSLRSAAEYVGLNLHCPIRLHGVCLNEYWDINTLSFWLTKV